MQQPMQHYINSRVIPLDTSTYLLYVLSATRVEIPGKTPFVYYSAKHYFLLYSPVIRKYPSVIRQVYATTPIIIAVGLPSVVVQYPYMF